MSTTPNPQPTVDGDLQNQLNATQTALNQVQAEPVAPAPEAPKQKFVVETATGQKFIGQTQADVIAEMQKSIENATTELARLHKREKEQPAAPAPALTQEQEAEIQTRKWIADQQAQYLGYQNADEMKASVTEMQEFTQLQRAQRMIGEFHDSNQDFPATKDAADALESTMKAYELPFSAKGMTAAHLICLREGKYQPVVAGGASATAATPNPTVPGTVHDPLRSSDEIDPTLPTAEYRRLLEEKMRLGGGGAR